MWDVAIWGGGVIGMAIAIELRLHGAEVIVIERQQPGRGASWAAAGMLAPGAEQLEPGALRTLAETSLALYPQWAAQIEALSGLPSGYWPCGILQPWADERGQWSQAELRQHQPGLATWVQSATWRPEEGQVDNRQLIPALEATLVTKGVTLYRDTAVTGWQVEGDRLVSLQTSAGPIRAEQYIMATGAWSAELLPLPVRPLKGQMLAVQAPNMALKHVLFGESVYIVPRRDRRIIIGATVEDVGFSSGNTAASVQQLLNVAIALYPPIAAMPLIDMWWGFRPSSPDLEPILGASPYRNLTLATGHHRNGILLAPATAIAIRQYLDGDAIDLSAFSWQRFK
ncbi:MAG: glycine oxidase ThiO [Synechococcaceae cyanobacterium SM2_3_60]|nr:glycine oxidase ThiO [Synechococcaceae cyanobacterium SM2_3_60]